MSKVTRVSDNEIRFVCDCGLQSFIRSEGDEGKLVVETLAPKKEGEADEKKNPPKKQKGIFL